MPTILHPASREEWLALRAEDVTSTEVAALFGLSPYCTEFELYHRKRNKDVAEIEQTERMKWGIRLEDTVAQGIAEDNGWKVRRLNSYQRHSEQRGMGASFDWEIVSHERGPGVLEVKCVDYIQWKQGWIDDGENSEAPEHIELQLQQQLEITGRSWGVIAAFVGGNKPIVMVRERDKEIGEKLCQRIAAFWKCVDAGYPPEPDYNRDADMLRRIYRDASGEPIVMTGNNRVSELCAKYVAGGELEKQGKAQKEAARSELLTIIGNAPKCLAGEYSISAGEVNKKEYLVKATTYRDFRVTQKKPAAA